MNTYTFRENKERKEFMDRELIEKAKKVKLKEDLKSLILSFGGISQIVGSMISKAFTVTAVVAVVKKLGDAVSTCFNDFSTANRKLK